MMVVQLLILLTLSASVRGEDLCAREAQCGGSCYATCDNQCGCDSSASVTYGGVCQDTGFCQGEFLHLEDCIEGGGPTCPNKMISMTQALELFTTYDYRIDVRSQPEWDEGHANMSIPTPGLAYHPASNYLDVIGGKEDANILVYCRSGGRAFDASLHLLKWGFKNINSFYHGGFPDLSARIKEESEKSSAHPTKNYCYVTGPSDICPTPLPIAHIKSVDDIRRMGDNIVLVDVRPRREPYLTSFKTAHRVTNSKKKIVKFLSTVEEDATIVVFCAESTAAFKAAKRMVKYFSGKVVWIDNGGYEDLKEIRGLQKL